MAALFVALVCLSSMGWAEEVPAGLVPPPISKDFLPGVREGKAPSVAPEAADPILRSRPAPQFRQIPGLPAKEAAVPVPEVTAPAPEIVELARGLRGDIGAIYLYVHDNIALSPGFGLHKSPLGTLLDGEGNPFDQAALMVALLRQSGITANYVYGDITLSAAQIAAWLGTDPTKACAGAYILSTAGVPVSAIVTSDGTCTGNLVSMTLRHVWVKVTSGANTWVFDPSFKQHTFTAGVDLKATMGYDQTAFLTAAETGAILTSNSIQNINKTSLRAKLGEYAGKIVTAAQKKASPSLDAILGGKTIQPGNGADRLTALPYQQAVVQEWTDIPDVYRATLTVGFYGINHTFFADDIYGRRLSLFLNASNQYQLALDGTVVDTSFTVPLNTYQILQVSIDHPFPGNSGTYGDQSGTQYLLTGGSFVIMNGWERAGRGLLDRQRRLLAEARAAGGADASEAVLGQSLQVIATAWLAEGNETQRLSDKVARQTTIFMHMVGVVGYTGAPYMDLPFSIASTRSLDGDLTKTLPPFFNDGIIGSAFEHGTIEQTQPVNAVSTVKVLDIASSSGQPIFDATSANFATIQPQLTNYNANELASVQSFLNSGYRVLMPKDGNITQDSWQGIGFLAVLENSSGAALSSIISGARSGGQASKPCPSLQVCVGELVVSLLSRLNNGGGDSIIQKIHDPVAVANGNLGYSRDDLTLGNGGLPFGLGFQRSYNSAARSSDVGLGRGWNHNFNITATSNSEPFQGMGEDSAADAASAIAALYVSLDLLSTSRSLDRMIIATLIDRWYMDQLTDNVVNVVQPNNTEQFVKLASGKFNPPPGSASTLTKPSGKYLYTTKFGVKLAFNTNGTLATWKTPAGMTVSFAYTAGKLSSVSNGLGRSLTLQYTNGRLSQVGDGARTVRYTYDTNGNLTQFSDAAGNATVFAYDQPGRLTKITYPSFPATPMVTNAYDSLGRVITQTSARNAKFTYFYTGLQTVEVDPLSKTTTYVFNARGQTIKETDKLGRITTTSYDAHNRPTKVVMPESNSVEYAYDKKHNPTKITLKPKTGSPAAAIVRSFTYDAKWNRPLTATDPLGRVTSYTYDATTGNLLSVKQPLVGGQTPTTTLTYNARGQVLTSTDPLGKVTRYTYDTTKGDLTQTTDDDGRLAITRRMTYDGVGNITGLTDARNNTSTLAYDAERRLIQTTAPAPLAFVTKLTYDADGRLTKTERQTGNTTTPWQTSTASYDAMGNLLIAAAPGNRKTTYTYDALDRVSKITDPLGRITNTAYDAMGRVAQITQVPNTATPAVTEVEASYTYSNNGKLATLTDGKGNTTAYAYDPFDRLLKTTYPDATFEQLTYDAGSNVTQRRNRKAELFKYTYDALDRLDAEDVPFSTTDIDYVYDLVGRLNSLSDSGSAIAYTYDTAGRLTSVTQPNGRKVSYAYDANSNRTRLTWPDGYFVSYTYDQLDRMTKVSENGTATLATPTWDALSRLTKLAYGNGTSVSFTLPPGTNDLKRVKHAFAAGATAQFDYLYNADGERTKQTVSDAAYLWKPTVASNDLYTANALNQYTKVNTQTITYDTRGNLLSDGANTFGYDAKNRLISASNTANTSTYAYDPLNRRVKKTVNGIATDYVLDGSREIAEYNGATLLRRNVWGPGFTPIATISAGGAKSYLHPDALGSVVAVSNATGAISEKHGYGPFGESDASAGSAFRYTGQRLDAETGLGFYKARMYSANIGRFLQPDPVGYADGPNAYAYVGNNPVNYVDPTGTLYDTASNLYDAITYLDWLPYQDPEALGRSLSLVEAVAGAGVGAAAGAEAGLSCAVVAGVGELVCSPVGALIGGYIVAQAGAHDGYYRGKSLAEQINYLKQEGAAAREDRVVQEFSRENRALNPKNGQPNSASHSAHANGELKQSRRYNENGDPQKDIDYDHDHGYGKPHVHEWTGGQRGPGRPLGPGETY